MVQNIVKKLNLLRRVHVH